MKIRYKVVVKGSRDLLVEFWAPPYLGNNMYCRESRIVNRQIGVWDSKYGVIGDPLL